MKDIVQLNDLHKTYGNFTAVDGLSLQVKEGDVYGFLGPNGAGKSTTIRMMLSLIAPTSGEVRIFDKSLITSREEIMRNVGCIIEKPDFYLYMSAVKNLQLFARMNGVNPSSKEVNELFDLVGLAGRQNDLVRTYSHGMKQRLGIAQTLIHSPKLIVLDEPTTGLDPKGIIDLRNLILRLKNEFGKTIILSSHILSEIELIADSMVIINKGKAVAQGRVSELLSNQDLIVTFELNDVVAAERLIQETVWQGKLRVSGSGELKLQVSKEEISEIIKLFVQHGILVNGATYKRTLEDYFLKLTANN